LTLEGQPYEVVGVLGENFVEPEALVRGRVDVWVPLDLNTPFLQTRNSYVLRTVARLTPGLSGNSAQEELDALAETLANEHPDDNRRLNGSAVQFPLRTLHEATVRDFGQTLSVLMGAVGLMLLIACANVANLYLARSTERSREMALRTALGAGKGRLLRLLLTESVMLGVVGGVLGVVLAVLGVKAFTVLNAGGLPRVAFVAVDWRVVSFAVVLSILTGILFGLLPALRSARSDFSSALREGAVSTTGTRNRNVTRDSLVVVEIALALVLLVGAGLLFNSFLHLRRVDPGFETENVVTAELRFGLPFGWGSTRYANAEAKAQFTSAVLEATRRIPGVVSVGGSLSSPFSPGCCWSTKVFRSDRAADSVDSWMRPVTHGYLETIGARLITGRMLTASDDQGEPYNADVNAEDDLGESFVSAIVNNTLARHLWPNESPLGGELIGGGLRARVVGVIDDVSQLPLDQMGQYDLYLPFLRTGTAFDRLELAVDYLGCTEIVAAAIRAAVWNIDPDLPVGTMLTMDQRMARSMNTPRFYSILFVVFAGVAFLLAASGIYASMTYVVGQRKRELGIRLALGGRLRNVLRMALGRGAMLTGLGVVIGACGASALFRLLDSLLFGITTTDITTFSSVALLLGVVAMLACYIPARRAACADPLEVLRAE
jgi:putative ABC transport system permease protein